MKLKDNASGTGGLGSIPGPVKSDIMWPISINHRGDVCALPKRQAAEIVSATGYMLRRNDIKKLIERPSAFAGRNHSWTRELFII